MQAGARAWATDALSIVNMSAVAAPEAIVALHQAGEATAARPGWVEVNLSMVAIVSPRYHGALGLGRRGHLKSAWMLALGRADIYSSLSMHTNQLTHTHAR